MALALEVADPLEAKPMGRKMAKMSPVFGLQLGSSCGELRKTAICDTKIMEDSCKMHMQQIDEPIDPCGSPKVLQVLLSCNPIRAWNQSWPSWYIIMVCTFLSSSYKQPKSEMDP